MLSELVRIEMPQLEASKAQILEENFESKETLSKIEDQILDNLSKNIIAIGGKNSKGFYLINIIHHQIIKNIL